MTRLGLVGTGLMGTAIVRRLRERGHPVTIWSRELEAVSTLLQLGASYADSPRDVASVSDIVLLCVLDTEAVWDCVFGPAVVVTAGRPMVQGAARRFDDFVAAGHGMEDGRAIVRSYRP